jgi:hypothetical protein
MKYKNVPPSLELALIMLVRSYGVELTDFWYDGQFAWYSYPVRIKKRRIKIEVVEVSDGDDNNNSIHRGVA